MHFFRGQCLLSFAIVVEAARPWRGLETGSESAYLRVDAHPVHDGEGSYVVVVVFVVVVCQWLPWGAGCSDSLLSACLT